MKRLSSTLIAMVATLLMAVPGESQAFFGFFGGGFSFGFGGGGWGGPGWWGGGPGRWGPGYWHRPYAYGYHYYRPYGGYPFLGYPYHSLIRPYYYAAPQLVVPTVKAPASAQEK